MATAFGVRGFLALGKVIYQGQGGLETLPYALYTQ
jgi:hypothetical protein